MSPVAYLCGVGRTIVNTHKVHNINLSNYYFVMVCIKIDNYITKVMTNSFFDTIGLSFELFII